MSGRGRASRAASAVTVTAYIVFAAASILLVAAVCIVGARPVQALPSYARQTGQQCAACHNGFPELTPYGRQFKLNGYVWTWAEYPISRRSMEEKMGTGRSKADFVADVLTNQAARLAWPRSGPPVS